MTASTIPCRPVLTPDGATTIPRGFKQTDAGLIPEDWHASSVGAEFSVQLGKMLDAARNSGEPKPYLGNRSVQWGRIDLAEIATVPMTPSDLQRFRLRRGDLLVCEGGEIGRAALWEEPLSECYYQKALHRLRPKGDFDPHLMMALLGLWTMTGRLANYVTQTSIAHLPKDKFELVPLPVPPSAEQRAIVDALSDVDGMLSALDALIAKKQAIKQAAMQQLLTGRTRLPGFGRAWETKRLGELGTTYGGLTGKRKADFEGGNARYVTFLNVLNNVVIDPDNVGIVSVAPTESQSRVRKGDLLFNGTSETPGDLAMAAVVEMDEPDLYLNSFCFGFRIHNQEEHSPLFTAYFFRGLPGRQLMHGLAQGATRYNMSKRHFMTLSLRLPDYDEQFAVAITLSEMDAEIAALARRRDKTRAIKVGMMQQLLTGRIRLIEPAKTVEASA